MFVHAITPQGAYTLLDLDALPVWRLELAAFQPPIGPPDRLATMLAVAISYVAAGSKVRTVLAGVDFKSADDAIAVVNIGLPHMDLTANRDRLSEAAKVLYNVDAYRKEAPTIVPQVARLADLYHAVVDAISSDVVGSAATSLTASTGPRVKGVLCDWKFAITSRRNDTWRTARDTLWNTDNGGFSFVAPTQSPAGHTTSLGGAPPAGNEPAPLIAARVSREKARTQRQAAMAAEKAGVPPAPEAPVEPETLKLDE